MSDTQGDLRAYYEEEARQGTRKPLRGRRVELRNEFIQLLKDEGRSAVVDFGAGPGGDGQAFIDAGVRHVGLDLSHGNAVLADQDQLTVLQASIAAPPLRESAFDAGWSMSTLMHISAAEVEDTLAAMVVPLKPGAPLLVAQWGSTGESNVEIDTNTLAGQQRYFGLRSFDHNCELLATAGHIEHATTWDVDVEAWQYHIIRIRTEG